MDTTGLSKWETEVYNESVERLNREQTLRVLTNLSETCFQTCVVSLRSTELSGAENSCIDTCISKFIEATRRSTDVFSNSVLRK